MKNKDCERKRMKYNKERARVSKDEHLLQQAREKKAEN